MKKGIKNILFKVELSGFGIVNYDSNEQKEMASQVNLKTKYNNNSFAKKNFYKNEETGELEYKIKISSDCLRNAIFGEDVVAQCGYLPNNVIVSTIASPYSLLRGYLNVDKNFKFKSPVTITDAEQTSNTKSVMETFSRSGQKNEDVEMTDNTFFKKETVGDISYATKGYIDLELLQFVSATPFYDRMAFNPEDFELYKTFLKTKLNNFDSKLGYYQKITSSINIPEYGFKFSEENVKELCKGFFKRLLSTKIKRKNSYANVSKVKIKYVFNPLTDTFDNPNGWIDINSENDIDFSMEDCYMIVPEKESSVLLEDINKIYKQKKSDLQKKKDGQSKRRSGGKKENEDNIEI